jgi:hypothetical protein
LRRSSDLPTGRLGQFGANRPHPDAPKRRDDCDLMFNRCILVLQARDYVDQHHTYLSGLIDLHSHFKEFRA